MNALDAILLPRHKEVGLRFEKDWDFILLIGRDNEVLGRWNSRTVSVIALREAADQKLSELTNGITFEQGG